MADAVVITTPEGNVYKSQELHINTGEETNTIALTMSGSGGQLPDSFNEAMNGTAGDKVFLLSR